ncbi:MAG: hypothetical protein ABJB21_06650 [bacterium]
MRRMSFLLFTGLIAISQGVIASMKVLSPEAPSFALATSEAGPQNGRPVRRRRRVHGDWGRRRHRGIGHAYKQAGLSAGHGGRRFGKHMWHGRPIHAGAAFGRGMGGFGKHFGKGTARVGKRIVKH